MGYNHRKIHRDVFFAHLTKLAHKFSTNNNFIDFLKFCKT